jgi:hypothetical protein
MLDGLLKAFQSATLGWLTIAFLITTCLVTYDKRIIQYKKSGALPPETPDAPGWTNIFAWAEIGLKVALLVINWQFGLLLYALGFMLATLGVLERVGNLVMSPLVGVRLPGDGPIWYTASDAVMQDMLIQGEKRLYIFRALMTAGAYLGITVLLNAV